MADDNDEETESDEDNVPLWKALCLSKVEVRQQEARKVSEG